mmetsp:Transcript_71951/g.203966  ORF Transcript_71951/g.203966 Transcript_71951/m.203966 type:complete len:286 (-) Transcript_71951:133-990(-)
MPVADSPHLSLLETGEVPTRLARAARSVRADKVVVNIHVVKLVGLDGRGDNVGHSVGAEPNPTDLSRVPELLHDVPPALLEYVVQRDLLVNAVEREQVDVADRAIDLHLAEGLLHRLLEVAGLFRRDLGLDDNILTLDLPRGNQRSEGVAELDLRRAVAQRRLEVVDAQLKRAADGGDKVVLARGVDATDVGRHRLGLAPPGLLNAHAAARYDRHLELGPAEANLGALVPRLWQRRVRRHALMDIARKVGAWRAGRLLALVLVDHLPRDLGLFIRRERRSAGTHG